MESDDDDLVLNENLADRMAAMALRGRSASGREGNPRTEFDKLAHI